MYAFRNSKEMNKIVCIINKKNYKRKEIEKMSVEESNKNNTNYGASYIRIHTDIQRVTSQKSVFVVPE